MKSWDEMTFFFTGPVTDRKEGVRYRQAGDRFMGKKRQQSGTKKYFTACVLFLVFMIFSICYFFYCVQVNVVDSAEDTIVDHVKRQGVHFKEIIDLQHDYLEGIADYIGASREMLSEENLRLLRSLCEKNNFVEMAIIDREGMATYKDGTRKDVSFRKYFREAVLGARSLSDPIASSVDGERHVILAVPIVRGGETAGVLAGSCDVGILNDLLFDDIYGGTGYNLIVTCEGAVVSYDGSEEEHHIRSGDNFFEYYGQMDFAEKNSIKQLQEYFSSQTGGCVRMKSDKGVSYLVCEPVELGGWMLCYLVPVGKVQEDYGFIRYYELILAGVLLGGLGVLLGYLWKQNRREQEELMEYAETDALTGAVNKASTEKKINQWLQETDGGIQAFLMLDVDNFKSVNDVYGHAAGDDALRQIGKALAQEFRGDDIIGRIGGDEFVVLMKNITDRESAVARVENMCQRIREISVKGVAGNPLSCSVGVVYSPDHGRSYQELYLRADKALYETKERGRNGYTIYSGDDET